MTARRRAFWNLAFAGVAAVGSLAGGIGTLAGHIDRPASAVSCVRHYDQVADFVAEHPREAELLARSRRVGDDDAETALEERCGSGDELISLFSRTTAPTPVSVPTPVSIPTPVPIPRPVPAPAGP